MSTRCSRDRVRVLGRYLNQGGETSRLCRLINRATSERVERSEPTSRRAPARLTARQNELLVQRYEVGARPVDIARELGVTEWTVHNRLNRLGVKRRGIGMSEKDFERAAALRVDEGMSMNQIAKHLGYAQATIKKALVARGVIDA